MQKMAKYSEDSILKSQSGERRERDICQEYITPDCLKHAGVPEMSTKSTSNLYEKEKQAIASCMETQCHSWWHE